MKFTFLLWMTTMLSLSTITACRKITPKDTTGKEFTSPYICPMHCEGSGNDTAGTCPVCGMDYVLLNEHISDGHKH